MSTVVSVPSSCQNSEVISNFLATLNQLEGSYTELAIAQPNTSRFNKARYFKHMSGAILTNLLKTNCNISFASGFKHFNEEIEEGKTYIRRGSDQFIALKNIISFDLDFKSFVPNYHSKVTNKDELTNTIFKKIKKHLDQINFQLWLGVFSGNGIHLHFKFSSPLQLESKTKYVEVYEAIIGYLNCQIPEVEFDVACKNPSRLMRLPFSTNWKDETNPIPCRVLYHNPEADFLPIYMKFKDSLTTQNQTPKENNSDKKLILSKLNFVKILEITFLSPVYQPN